MCFFWLGSLVANQQREIADLRSQLETLKTKSAA
jgi:hypothetical protein